MDYYEEGDFERPRPRDRKIDEAKEQIGKFFEENTERVYYLMQLEVLFEKKPFGFHWITYKAVNELIEEGLLNAEEVPLFERTIVKFVFSRKFRYYKMAVRRAIEVIREYTAVQDN